MIDQNILFISSRSDIGGGPKHLVDLVKTLRSLNYPGKIFIAAPQRGHFSENFIDLSDSFFPLPERKFSIAAALRLKHFAKANKVRIIHSHGRGAGVFSRTLKPFGFKVVHTFHGCFIEKSVLGYLKVLSDRCFRFFTDHFICVSESEKKQILKLGLTRKSRTTVVPNGIDIFKVNLENKVMKFNNIDLENKILFGSLSRLTNQKGIDILIKNLSESNLPQEIQFLVAGEGEERSRLEHLIKEKKVTNLSLLGEVNKPLTFLNTIDIYFSSARSEGLPLAVLESFLLKRPCLLSNVDGHKEFTHSASFYNLHDSKDFQKKVLEIAYSAKLKKQLTSQGATELKEIYNVKKMTNSTLQIYKAIN